MVGGSLWRLPASLLHHHVRGVPIGPVLVALPGSLFVQSVGSFRTSKRARQVVRRREGRRRGVDATRQPRCDLLEQPPVAVQVSERDVRVVTARRTVAVCFPSAEDANRTL